MTDEKLQSLMHEAKHTYRVPADPPLDAMWSRIEREHFDGVTAAPTLQANGHVNGRARRWLAPLLAIAATLAIGVGIGRFTAPAARAVAELPAARDASGPAATNGSDPLQRATSEYIDETVALLASLPRDSIATLVGGNAKFVAQASLLLATTRLLMDSPAASDPQLRDLLEDLELVLAQVARLRTTPRAEELTFIAEAMDQRDVVPRLRTVAASLSVSGY